MDIDRQPQAEGKKFDFLPESEIKSGELMTFRFLDTEQYIKTETHEFSAVCPFSGLPDLASITIEYYPCGRKCVELKSLKYYFVSFRNVGIYQEAVTTRIFNDLTQVLQTNRIKVTTIYQTRGGFDTTCIKGDV